MRAAVRRREPEARRVGDRAPVGAGLRTLRVRDLGRRVERGPLGLTRPGDRRLRLEGRDRGIFEREVGAYRCRVISLGDTWMVATFDGPGRAVRCGWAVSAVARRSNITVHAGVHVGECDLDEPDGPLVAVAAGIAGAAKPAEVLVSRTVVDLVPGSGMQFADRGRLKITGLDSELPVFAVVGV